MNVLQRFGISYFFVATMYIFMQLPIGGNPDESGRFKKAIKDIWSLWPQWLISCIVVIIYLALTFALPVPGCPT